MRKTTGDYARASSIIQADKSVMSEACKALVLNDFADKFNEYFDVCGLPKMELVCKNGLYLISVSFEAERIKKFNVLK